jgi:RluA family pseudouridine synthase
LRSEAAERFDPPLLRLDWRPERRLDRAGFLADARARLADDARFESALWHGGLSVNGIPWLAEAAPVEVPPGSRARLYAFLREPAPVPLGSHAVLHEDADLLAVAKPAWLPTQPTRASRRLCLEAALRERLGEPGLVAVHRLDRQTSGLVLFARHRAAARALGRAFARGAVAKRYLALVAPAPREAAFEVRARLGPVPDRARHRFAPVPPEAPGRPSHSRFRVLAVGAGRALLLAEPVTGRSHQLRVHLASRGHPVAGDDLYGPPFLPGAPSAAQRVQLHAWRLALAAGEGRPGRRFEAPPPPDFEAGALVPCATRPCPASGGAEARWT